jgi:hypothetical protein
VKRPIRSKLGRERHGIKLFRIITGGQTGADRGGLLAGRELGIQTGGRAPKGWWTENGSEEETLRGFGLIECSEPGYDARTRKNVLDADGTLLLGSRDGGGSALTANVATEAKKPFFHVPYPGLENAEGIDEASARFRAWLTRHGIRTLNVAGNRESQNPGLQEFTRRFLISALRSGSL